MIVLVHYPHAITQEYRRDRGLLRSNQLIELALPILVRVTNTHANAICHALAVSFFKQRHNRERLVRLLGVIAGQRTPQYASIDSVIDYVVDHRSSGRVVPRVDY